MRLQVARVSHSARIGRAQWVLSIAPYGKVNTKGGRSRFVDLGYDDLPMRRITPAANDALLMRVTALLEKPRLLVRTENRLMLCKVKRILVGRVPKLT